jgi:hypothetical protein
LSDLPKACGKKCGQSNVAPTATAVPQNSRRLRLAPFLGFFGSMNLTVEA